MILINPLDFWFIPFVTFVFAGLMALGLIWFEKILDVLGK